MTQKTAASDASTDPAILALSPAYSSCAMSGINPDATALTTASPEKAEAEYSRYESARYPLSVCAVSFTANPTSTRAAVGTIQCISFAAGGIVQANQARPMAWAGAAKAKPMILSSLLFSSVTYNQDSKVSRTVGWELSGAGGPGQPSYPTGEG